MANAKPKSVTLYDSTLVQIESIERLASENLSLDDFSTPQMASLLLERHRVTLTELKSKQGQLNEAEKEMARVSSELTELRVELARAEERQFSLWLEIPLGIFSGFAINILTGDIRNGVGWFILIVSLLMLLFIRLSALFKQNKKNHGKEN